MRQFNCAQCLGFSLWLMLGHTVMAASETTPLSKRDPLMTQHASGAFDVKLNTLSLADGDAPDSLGRKGLDKQFHGDLEASSKGEMLFASTATPGSAGYVAIELVTGTLQGKRGSFALQHSGTMTRGTPQLSVTVVPDSGTDELTGLSGRMDIQIADGKHSYTFDYSLPPGTNNP